MNTTLAALFSSLFDAPEVVHHLSPWAWAGLVVLSLVGMLACAIAVTGFEGKVAGWIIAAGSLLLCGAIYGMLRAVPPGINAEWWCVVAPTLVLAAGVAFVGVRSGRLTEGLGSFAGALGAVAAAAYLDKANEYLGGIPVGWGIVVIVALVMFLAAKSD